MLTNRIGEVNISNASLGWASGGILSARDARALSWWWPSRCPGRCAHRRAAPTTAPLGHALLQQWLLPFELASLILLATLIGAIVIARKEIRAE